MVLQVLLSGFLLLGSGNARDTVRPLAAHGELLPDDRMKYFLDLQTWNEEYISYCEGTLLAPGWVVTAAHCVMSTDRQTIDGVKFRLHDRDGGHTVVLPSNFSLFVPDGYHPDQKWAPSDMFFGDIALIQVPDLFDLDEVYPQLPENRDQVKNAPILVVAGTGLDAQGSRSNELTFITLSMYGGAGEAPHPFRIPEDHFVAIDTGIPTYQDTCAGDSGGGVVIPSCSWPLGLDWELDDVRDELNAPIDTLVGVTSFGYQVDGCGSEGSFGAYTDVLYWKPWILSVLDAHPFE